MLKKPQLQYYDILQVYSGAHVCTMIFSRTKAEANELALSFSLEQDCQVLHGDIQQKQRETLTKDATLCVHVYTCTMSCMYIMVLCRCTCTCIQFPLMWSVD